MLLDPEAAGDEVAAVHAPSNSSKIAAAFTPDSRQAWLRLALAVLIASVGAVGMWSVVVVMPVVQQEFAATRGAVSLAATMIFFGFGLGGVITGKITDRLGIVPAMAVSIAFLAGSYVLAGLSTALWQFIVISFLMGLGTSATFAPLMAEASHWFERYRGLAVTIVAQRQLYRRHVLAAADQLEHGDLWLARHPFRHRHRLRGVDDDPGAGAAPGHGRQRGARSRQCAAAAGRSQPVGQYADGVAVHRQHFLLRGDGDAAGSHRRPIAATSAMASRAARKCCR